MACLSVISRWNRLKLHVRIEKVNMKSAMPRHSRCTRGELSTCPSPLGVVVINVRHQGPLGHLSDSLTCMTRNFKQVHLFFTLPPETGVPTFQSLTRPFTSKPWQWDSLENMFLAIRRLGTKRIPNLQESPMSL